MSLIKCDACGKEISDTCEKCVHCGSVILKKTKCLECGAEVLVTDDICHNCGSKMKKEKVIRLSKKKIVLAVVGLLVVIVTIIAVASGSGVDLKEVYDTIGANSTYCKVAGDGSYLEIDTNPYDIDDYFSYEAVQYIRSANEELGFTEALYTRMMNTRALDGTLEEENDKIRVTWTYHPDNGLEAVYTLK